MSQTVIQFRIAPAAPLAPGLWQRLRAAFAAAETRQQLAALDDRALRDIGISRAQAQFEAGRWELVPFLHR